MHLYGIDKHLRFRSVAELLHDREMVLDVGGGRGDFFDFAPCRGIVADLPPDLSLFGGAKIPHPIVYFDGVSLPFRDESFDTVVCLDTLEHASKRRRSALLHELQRVSSNRVILTFPERQFFLPVLLAIARLYDRLKINSLMLKSLEEHRRFGLPSSDEVLTSVDADKWASRTLTFMGRRATIFWITQLFVPFLATPGVNKRAANFLSPFSEYLASECLIILQRIRNEIADTMDL
jgi:methyltransferase family protein